MQTTEDCIPLIYLTAVQLMSLGFLYVQKNRTRNTKIKMYTGLVLQREHMLFNNYLITSVSHKAHSHRISEISFYFIDNLILTSVSFCD